MYISEMILHKKDDNFNSKITYNYKLYVYNNIIIP